MVLTVSSLNFFPVKGGRGIALEHMGLEPRGPVGDRRWLITDETGKFITQRDCGALARLVATPVDAGLRLEFPGAADEMVPFPAGDERAKVTIWGDEVDAAAASEKGNTWLTDAIGRPVRLYYMDDAAERLTSGKWGAAAPVSFADGYPLLVTTTASLVALNEVLIAEGGDAVGMERFRPNIVIDGADPWAEDYWGAINIGGLVIDLQKPCTRCTVPNIDQATGETTGRDPLRTLSRIRRSAHPDVPGALFGWNGLVRAAGDISCGDEVTVVETRPEGWPLAKA